MIAFLIKRPIAVIMSVFAFCILGGLAFFSMPVSLLPDIDIPHLKVKITYPFNNARSIENAITQPIRQQLSQLSGLKNINSESREGAAEILLEFNYSTKTDYAFIEANEKMDAIISQLPKDLDRPLIIKEKPSDIPVFYLNIKPNKEFYNQGRDFHEFSELIRNDIKRRIEQLDEVSLVDISGLSHSQITIEPDPILLRNLGIDYHDIDEVIRNNHLTSESLKFSQGHYTYNLHLSSTELSIEKIKKLRIYKNGKFYQIEDFADVKEENGYNNSLYMHDMEKAVSMAIYKQSASRMQNVKDEISYLLIKLKAQFPSLKFEIERDQTQLLKTSIDNLNQTLFLSVLMALLILFIFIRQYKLTIIFIISIAVSLIISFFFLHLANISLNIFSLSGLILSVGLMIDNSIIVIDNINQYKVNGRKTKTVSVRGTNEIIRPLISSVLTTCAVFLPLLSLSGISGALFYDQAITISMSLLSSLMVSIILIPVLYTLFISDVDKTSATKLSMVLLNGYNKTLNFSLKYRVNFLFIPFLLIPISYFTYQKMDKQKLPEMQESDLICAIEWNQSISLKEMDHRTKEFVNKIFPKPKHSSCYLGENEFLMTETILKSKDASFIYLDYDEFIDLHQQKRELTDLLNRQFPQARIGIFPSENLFQKIFPEGEIKQTAIFRSTNSQVISENKTIEINQLLEKYPKFKTPQLVSKYNYQISILYENLLLYHIDYQLLVNKLKIIFGGRQIDEIQYGNQSLKILVREQKKNVFESIASESITNSDGIDIPLTSLLHIQMANTPNTINADEQGEYLSCQPIPQMNKIEFKKTILHIQKDLENIWVSYTDTDANQKILFSDLLRVLMVSLLLLYLILAAQFESLLLPIIILLELVFDIAGALLFLYAFDLSLNIMSGLGIIVMSGIIINDSIIKIDTIHKSFKMNRNAMKAIKIGGHRRFLPIIITSLTTILSLSPLLFFGGMGVELQLPLAISIIGGLFIGTFVSLYIIPLMYFYYTRFFYSV